MVNIAWNPIGFHVLRAIRTGRRFNNNYYWSQIFRRLSEWYHEQFGGAGSKLILHTDNNHLHPPVASQQFIEGKKITRVSHLPHSPDLAPPGVSLVGHINHCRRGNHSRRSKSLAGSWQDGEKSLLDAVFSRINGKILEMHSQKLKMNTLNRFDKVERRT
jgi:hypothetical protein